jgi:hypothetical protein
VWNCKKFSNFVYTMKYSLYSNRLELLLKRCTFICKLRAMSQVVHSFLVLFINVFLHVL